MERKFAPMQLDIRLPDKYLHTKYVKTPWEKYLKMYESYAACYGHSQSAERICERGGLGIREVVELGIKDIHLYLGFGNEYPKKDTDWVHLHLIFNDDDLGYKWSVIKPLKGWTEGENLVLPRQILVMIKEEYENEKDIGEKTLGKIELINELIAIIDKKEV